MKKERFSNINAGGIMLLMIAALLCLAIFGALSVSSAYADLRLADKLAQSTVNYYNADAEAQRTLAQVADVIRQAPTDSGDAAYLSAVKQGVEALGISAQEEEGALTIRFALPVDERQQLAVELYTDYDLRDYVMNSYLVERTVEEDYSGEPLDLWDGTTID